MGKVTTLSAEQIDSGAREQERVRDRLADARMQWRNGDSRARHVRAQLGQAEARRDEYATVARQLAKARDLVAELPDGPMERLRSKVPSDHGGRAGGYVAGMSGAVLRGALESIAAHAEQLRDVESATLASLREQLTRAEEELGPIAARVEALRAQVA